MPLVMVNWWPNQHKCWWLWKTYLRFLIHAHVIMTKNTIIFNCNATVSQTNIECFKNYFFSRGSHFVTTGRVLGAKKGRQVDTDKLVSISRTNNLHQDKSPADLQLIEIVITVWHTLWPHRRVYVYYYFFFIIILCLVTQDAASRLLTYQPQQKLFLRWQCSSQTKYVLKDFTKQPRYLYTI